MDRRFLTVLGVSLVFSLIVTTVFYQMTAHGSSKPASNPDQKDIVEAVKPLGVGVAIKPTDVKVVKIPADAFPKGAYSKVEDVLDRPVISNILADEPILDGRLALKGSGLGLAPTIPVGMRAVAVRVNDVAGVAGFVLPGMHVDVLVTGHPPNGDGSDMTTTCLQNMQVLSAGQTITADANGRPMPAPLVTLLANPDQAELLTLANSDGHIQLVLRNSSDQGVEKTPGRFVTDLYGVARKPGKPSAQDGTEAPPVRPRPRPVVTAQAAPPPPAAAPAPPPPDQVIVIRGNQRTVEVLPSRNN